MMTILNWKKILTLLLMVLAIIQCSIDKPVMPKWTTPFLIPIMKERVLFAEKFTNDSTIVLKGDSLYLELKGNFEPDTLTSSDLRLEGVDSTSSYTLDKIELDSLRTISTDTIGIVEVLPYLGNFINQTLPFPDTTLASSALIIDSSEFKRMKVKSGEVILSLHNHLPLTIAPASPGENSIFISIYNQLNGTHVTDIPITETIPPGGTGTGVGQLGEGDGWVFIPLQLNYQIHFLARNIFITQDSLDSWNFKIDLSFKNLEVEEIIGRVSPQTVDDTLRIGIDEEDKVIEAVIDSGSIQLRFYNELPLATQLRYILPDLVNQTTGQPFQGQLSLRAQDSVAHNIQNLHGYRIYNSQQPGIPIDTLTVFTQGFSDTGFVSLSIYDSIKVRVVTSNLLLSYIKGILSPDTLKLDPLLVKDIIDYNNFVQGFQLKGVQLLLDVNNQLNVENLQLSGTIVGYKKNEYSQYTDSATVLIPPTDLIYGHNTILLQGHDIDNLINIFPTDLKTEGIIAYGGVAEVSVGDLVSGSYFFTTPFWVLINDAAPIGITPDTLEDIDEEFKNALGDNIRYAKLSGQIINSSPLSGTVELFISGDFTREDLYDTTAYFNPDREFVKVINISPAHIDPQTGFVSQAVTSNYSIDLNRKELTIFQNPPLRTGWRIRLNDTNGYVIMRGSDYLEFSGKIETEIIFRDPTQ